MGDGLGGGGFLYARDLGGSSLNPSSHSALPGILAAYLIAFPSFPLSRSLISRRISLGSRLSSWKIRRLFLGGGDAGSTRIRPLYSLPASRRLAVIDMLIGWVTAPNARRPLGACDPLHRLWVRISTYYSRDGPDSYGSSSKTVARHSMPP